DLCKKMFIFAIIIYEVMTEDNIKKVADILLKKEYIVALTGSGISVASGLRTFRGVNGLWEEYNPQALEISYFYEHRAESWDWIYKLFFEPLKNAKPNAAHYALAELENMGKLNAIITQNIDGLHQDAGSKNVIEFHGTTKNLICTKCGAGYSRDEIDFSVLPPKCSKCGEILKPDFVFFGEMIPHKAAEYAYHHAMHCDAMLIIGTSGIVMPAADLPRIAKQNNATLIEINLEQHNDRFFAPDIFIQGDATVILPKLVEEIKK
ncbi:MAG TPA: NAD-dependent deacylase, partial [Bacteroidales bacterium]|nr:NAD-dependent deacylase [Bacteroidales bacterium]HOC40498.1 NAD-dependent deacylase [Bacteroidales bacterium]